MLFSRPASSSVYSAEIKPQKNQKKKSEKNQKKNQKKIEYLPVKAPKNIWKKLDISPLHTRLLSYSVRIIPRELDFSKHLYKYIQDQLHYAILVHPVCTGNTQKLGSTSSS